jgi:hypothetical protein
MSFRSPEWYDSERCCDDCGICTPMLRRCTPDGHPTGIDGMKLCPDCRDARQ